MPFCKHVLSKVILVPCSINIKQIKQDNVAHREATINNVDTVKHCVGGHIKVVFF